MARILTVIVAFLALTSLSRASAEQLAGAQIEWLVTGHQLTGMNEMAQTYWQCYRADHTMSGQSNNRSGPQQDTGTWSVRGNQLCQQWNSWRDHQELCHGVNYDNGSYTWIGGFTAGLTFSVSACP